MKRLSEYKNEEAIEILAELIDPAISIFGDEELKNAYRNNSKKSDLIKVALKNHPSEIIKIMAILEQKDVEEYECNLLTLPIKIMQILNDPDLQSFFMEQASEIQDESSGAVSENTMAHSK